ncbi:hypothetical protein [Arthrobacter sp. ISL-30]|uniref:hypothetical protein n=1 Tax=Arthrobacter sp. ISL-30 TaxID=2819109 RepID=UPI001BE9DAB9|nr:hypothetical protein [Arthrobacter sp. ISL-30]MBT2513443.1 hypothetical protein [Arthrobacter sp. ISL-30]
MSAFLSMAVGQHPAEPVEAVVGPIVDCLGSQVKRLNDAFRSAAFDDAALSATASGSPAARLA